VHSSSRFGGAFAMISPKKTHVSANDVTARPLNATRRRDMANPFDITTTARDPRALPILAKTIYRELRSSGYGERDVIALAGELLGMVATEVKDRRGDA
jgi:hypothetical protein